ncbi:hypothetical protein [Pollutimonas sp. M17]|uniref:hypothetical protein n=1 Tax=Pollutimonas sp. M17 TaxID=2962065 RepID=UPI0021F445CB|nr:hypothetical protein [Pollutimonas sp. M17]UYO92502.1 hypothetical protein OEG81_11305 [Pollutimonas sp. M17]
MNGKMNFFKPLLVGGFALASAFGSAAWANETHAGMTADQISSQYDSAMKHCDSLKGNDKDVCEEKAKAQRDSAKADAKAGKASAEAQHDATEEERDSAYNVAKEKCDAMSGDAKDQCITQAKTKFGK